LKCPGVPLESCRSEEKPSTRNGRSCRTQHVRRHEVPTNPFW
jgi:hypothetical protein